jgi:hypothetical protein
VSGGIYLLNGDQLLEMVEQRYDTEDVLQALIAKFPSLLAGDQFGENGPRRWVLVAREAGLPSEVDGGGRWSVDHLFLDQDAVPTLVEVKRSSDTRIRREVVGQILDYAAHAVVNWPEERLRELFERRCEADRLDPESEIAAVLTPDADADAFWQQAWTNLRAGRIRLVLLSDEIPNELRRVVEFLNGQMDPAEVIAIEVKQYVGDGVKTLVPRAIGQTAAVEARKGQRESRTWDEASFFAELEAKRSADEVRVARELVAWSRSHMSRLTWGRGKVDGSCVPVLDVGTVSVYPFAIYTYGRVEVQFQWLRARPFDDESARLELLRRINEAPGVDLPDDGITRRPSIPLSVLAADPSALARFTDAISWALDAVRAELTPA